MTTSSGAARVPEIFDDVQLHHLLRDGEVIQVFEPELSPLQLQVLDLLHVPAATYWSSSSARVGADTGRGKCGT